MKLRVDYFFTEMHQLFRDFTANNVLKFIFLFSKGTSFLARRIITTISFFMK